MENHIKQNKFVISVKSLILIGTLFLLCKNRFFFFTVVHVWCMGTYDQGVRTIGIPGSGLFCEYILYVFSESLGGTSLSSGISSLTMNSSPPPPDRSDIPPPLPPRRKRETSSSGCELSPIRTMLPMPPFSSPKEPVGIPPPVIPPKEMPDDLPPPLPPRRDRGGSLEGVHLQGNMTLPRSFRMPQHPGSLQTLPRRNSERDNLGSSIMRDPPQPQFVNMNGNRGVSVTPKLPPKTYNRSVLHSRQQSS